MPELSPEQKRKISEALIALDPAETLKTLKGESIGIITDVLGCSTDEAVTVLKDLEDSKLIEAGITPGRELDVRKPMLAARWSWVSSTNN